MGIPALAGVGPTKYITCPLISNGNLSPSLIIWTSLLCAASRAVYSTPLISILSPAFRSVMTSSVRGVVNFLTVIVCFSIPLESSNPKSLYSYACLNDILYLLHRQACYVTGVQFNMYG